MENYFTELNDIDVNGHTEKKSEQTYLPWAWAWTEVKKKHQDANYTVYENKDGLIYHTDGNTCWVKTGVTINGIEHIEYLPVMDNKNKSIPVASVTSFDVNKAIQRSLTKACARHGLGLYIYANEDSPEKEPETRPELSEECKQQIKDCKTVDELTEFYKKAKNEIPAELNAEFLSLLSARKSELEKNVKNN